MGGWDTQKMIDILVPSHVDATISIFFRTAAGEDGAMFGWGGHEIIGLLPGFQR